MDNGDAACLDVNIDFGNLSGYFVRVDVELPRQSVYSAVRDDGGPMGWIALMPDEADDLAERLKQSAREVRSLVAGGG